MGSRGAPVRDKVGSREPGRTTGLAPGQPAGAMLGAGAMLPEGWQAVARVPAEPVRCAPLPADTRVGKATGSVLTGGNWWQRGGGGVTAHTRGGEVGKVPERGTLHRSLLCHPGRQVPAGPSAPGAGREAPAVLPPAEVGAAWPHRIPSLRTGRGGGMQNPGTPKAAPSWHPAEPTPGQRETGAPGPSCPVASDGTKRCCCW